MLFTFRPLSTSAQLTFITANFHAPTIRHQLHTKICTGIRTAPPVSVRINALTCR